MNLEPQSLRSSKKRTQETSSKTTRRERSRSLIIQLLKNEGPMDANMLSNHLNISGMAVRQHLQSLLAEGLVKYKEEARAMGRPVKMWQLTEKADPLFPQGYAELSLSLFHSVQQAFGEEGLEKLLSVRNEQQLQHYRKSVSETGILKRKLESLASIRTKEGYMAEVVTKQDGVYWFVEKHCPIRKIAQSCHKLCHCELELFQQVLGTEVRIRRIEHMVSGGRRCVYECSEA